MIHMISYIKPAARSLDPTTSMISSPNIHENTYPYLLLI